MSAPRAAVLSAGATASSRSRMTASARSSALPNRSGRSAGQKRIAGPRSKVMPALPERLIGVPAPHEGDPRRDGDDDALLVAAGVAERDDPLPRAGSRASLLDDLGLGVEGVAVEERRRERDVGEAELRDERALGDLRDGCPDHRRERPHRVHQPLAERLGRRERGVEMQRLAVHRERGEEDVVGLGRGPARPVQVADTDLELFVVEPALHDLVGALRGVLVPAGAVAHGRHATREGRARAR